MLVVLFFFLFSLLPPANFFFYSKSNQKIEGNVVKNSETIIFENQTNCKQTKIYNENKILITEALNKESKNNFCQNSKFKKYKNLTENFEICEDV